MKALRNRLTGYVGVSTREMLEHLYATYGDIMTKDLADNHQKMNTPYDPNQPFENLVDQIDEATELADAAEAPYTVPRMVSIRYILFQQTGIFTIECQTWDKKSPADKHGNISIVFQLHIRRRGGIIQLYNKLVIMM